MTNCVASSALATDPVLAGDLIVQSIDEVSIPARLAGQLKRLDVRVGDTVKAGQVIAQLDDQAARAVMSIVETEWELARQDAENFVGDREAKIVADEKLSVLEQSRLVAKVAKEKSANQVRVSAAEKNEAVAKNEWNRAALARQKFVDSVSESELESLRLKFEHAQLERLQAVFDLQMQRLASQGEAEAVHVAELVAKRAELDVKTAVSEASRLRLEIESKQKLMNLRAIEVAQHQVLSPIDGIIVKVEQPAGSWVKPGDSVAEVLNLDQLHAEGFLKAGELPVRGQTVTLVSIDENETPRSTEARVDFVSPRRDPVSGEIRFLVRLGGDTFRPGERVDVRWTTAR